MNNTVTYGQLNTERDSTEKSYVGVRDSIIFAAILLLSMVPLSTVGNLLRFVVVAAAFMIVGAYRFDRMTLDIFFFIALCFALSFITVGLSENGTVNNSELLHEIARMGLLVLLLFTVRKLRVSMKFAVWCGFIFVLINLGIQILQYYHVEAVMNFLRSNYVFSTNSWTHLDLAYATGSNFRAGSVFINPNVYMAVPVLVMCLVLEYYRKKFTVMGLIMCFLCSVSCILTGSRTTTIIIGIMLLYYIIRYLKGVWKPLVVIIVLLLLLPNWSYLGESLRAFSFESLVDDSLSVKIQLYFGFIATSNLQYWLFGSLGSTEVFNSMDSELMYVIAYYGLFGITWYAMLLRYSFKINRSLRFFSVSFLIILLLVGITATLFLCLPVATFVIAFGFVNYEVEPDKEVADTSMLSPGVV